MVEGKVANRLGLSFVCRKYRIVLFCILVLLCSGQVWAQSSLGDLVREGGKEWMIGTWTATTPDSEVVSLTYKWELPGNLISISLKTAEFQFKGMIMYQASISQVVQVGADTLGRTAKGTWEGEYGPTILRQTTTNAYGQDEVTEFVHAQKDRDTMTITVKKISNQGWSDTFPNITLEFEREK